jgi:hypothetical protein
MKGMRAIFAVSVVAVVLPVVAQAAHKPGHAPGQPNPTADLSIAAAPNPTLFQRATVIAGRLKGPGNAGRTVVLREDAFPFGTAVENVATATTGANGDYAFTRHPARNTAYQAVVGTTVSATTVVDVRIRIGLRVSDATPQVGQLVRFGGRACPAHDGLPARIQRRTASGTFRTVRRTTLRGATGCSVYTRRFRVYRDGAYRVVADDADHARGFSPTRFVNTPR